MILSHSICLTFGLLKTKQGEIFRPYYAGIFIFGLISLAKNYMINHFSGFERMRPRSNTLHRRCLRQHRRQLHLQVPTWSQPRGITHRCNLLFRRKGGTLLLRLPNRCLFRWHRWAVQTGQMLLHPGGSLGFRVLSVSQTRDPGLWWFVSQGVWICGQCGR